MTSTLLSRRKNFSEMGKKKAIRLVGPDRPLFPGRPELLELHLKVPQATEVVDAVAVFEGRCRASFGGQDALHTLCVERLHVPIQPLLIPSTKGVLILPPGAYKVPILVKIPPDLPGTFTGKHGGIAYRAMVKLRLRKFPSIDEADLETEKVVDVLGSVRQMHDLPVPLAIDRHVKKKIFCFNRLDAKVSFELERTSFGVGEHILVMGTVENQHSLRPMKQFSLELRQKLLYSCGDAKKTDSRLICRLVCGTVPPAETLKIHHSLQIPMDCYPSLQIQGNPIQVGYEVIATCHGQFEIEAPIFIANYPHRHSIQFLDSSSEKNSSIYYCIPPSERSYASSRDPPPYSTHSSSKGHFIPIHRINTPLRPLFGWPPHYDSGPPPPRFLKIEEIND